MQVIVKVFSILKEVVGNSLLMLEVKEGGKLQDVLIQLNQKYGAAFQRETGKTLDYALERRLNVFLNGKSTKLPDDSNLKLKNNDEIVILEPVGGGSN